MESFHHLSTEIGFYPLYSLPDMKWQRGIKGVAGSEFVILTPAWWDKIRDQSYVS